MPNVTFVCRIKKRQFVLALRQIISNRNALIRKHNHILIVSQQIKVIGLVAGPVLLGARQPAWLLLALLQRNIDIFSMIQRLLIKYRYLGLLRIKYMQRAVGCSHFPGELEFSRSTTGSSYALDITTA